MANSRKQYIDDAVENSKDSISAIDESFYTDMSGVAQAVVQLRKALDKVDTCLNQREFEKASSLGYSDVSSEFIFLQRCLGSLNDTVMQKEKIIQDICLEVSDEVVKIKNEDVAVLVENKMESLKPIASPKKIEILLGNETVEKLQLLHEIRHTPIEHLVEVIIASAMRDQEKHWQKAEEEKLVIPKSKTENKTYYSVDEVASHIKALSEQQAERLNNLY